MIFIFDEIYDENADNDDQSQAFGNAIIIINRMMMMMIMMIMMMMMMMIMILMPMHSDDAESDAII